MSRVQVVTLPKIGDVSIVCKTKRDISVETPLDKRDDESLGWGYWDRIWPSEVALAEYLIHRFSPAKLTGAKVLEIGCGTGVAGVVTAHLGAFTMFSDLVPVTLEAVKETCRLNHINNFDTCTLDWSEKIESKDGYDYVIGSEVFYDEVILADISYLLEQVLAPGGKGIFCDPNRLGLDTIELGFQKNFNLSVEQIPLHWPPRKGNGIKKMVYRYELTARAHTTSRRNHYSPADAFRCSLIKLTVNKEPDTIFSMFQTLVEYAASSWKGSQEYDGLDAVVAGIAEGAQQIQAKVRAAVLAHAVGVTGETNVQGEVVQILDTFSSDALVDTLKKCGRVAAIGSEEIEETVIVGDSPAHQYLVQMDPLDGSSNIDVAVSVGSILGIWKRQADEKVTDATLLKKGNEQVAAVYTVYGSCTMMVVGTRENVQGFTLDPADDTFRLTYPDIRIPGKNSCYSTNEGNFKGMDAGTQKAVEELRNTYSLRYAGSLVADFHRNLLKGGIFLYPGTAKSPEGKLRLMYEANPLAFIAEQAGGAASSGKERILEIQPLKLHQRTALIIGNKDVVERTVAVINNG